MDAFIVPGAKMPTFAIRQQLVKKYGVDRRHLYDYFHSRGLRVSKEDKHQNLSNRMSRKPAASRKPKASRVIPPEDMDVDSPTLLDSPAFDPTPASPIANQDEADSLTIPDSDTEPDQAPVVFKSKATKKRRTTGSSRQSTDTHKSVSPPPPSLRSKDVSSDSSDCSDSEDSRSPSFDFTDTLTESSSFASFDESLNMLAMGYPVSDDKLRETFGPDFIPFPPASPEDPLFGLAESHLAVPETYNHSASDTLIPLDNFSEKDRNEFYNLVNAGIGPARGFEECAGTYKAHMDRLYSNRFYPLPHLQPLPVPTHRDPCSSATTAVARPPTAAEKENIRPSMSVPRSVVDAQPSNQYYRHIAAVSSPLRRRNSHYPARTQPPPSLAHKTTHPTKPLLLPSVNPTTARIIAPLPRDPRLHPAALVWTSPITYSSPAPQMPWPVSAQNPFPISAFYTPSGERVIYHSNSFSSRQA
ncbi:hypothetical protein C8R46DRAFT_1124636 [Mycena filopes]|nr:hypothetical protein C8R46DRAFT_1124636 [Mycena filopes]